MAFPLPLAAVMTGATKSQLIDWRDRGLVVPEVQPYRPPLYSFRDLILLRSLVFMRTDTPMQRIAKALSRLHLTDPDTHPSEFEFGTNGTSIMARIGDQPPFELVGHHPGNGIMFTFEEMFDSFPNFRGTHIPDFFHPEPRLEVAPARLGGWPTVTGTRVGYDTVARLVDFETVRPEDVEYYYPGVSAEAAMDAVTLERKTAEVVGA